MTVGSNARAPPSTRTSTRNREIIVPSATLIEHSEVEITASQLEVPHIDKLRAKLLPVILLNVPLDSTADCLGINTRHIYCGNSCKPHSYASRKTECQHNQFVDRFCSRIIDRLDNKGRYH